MFLHQSLQLNHVVCEQRDKQKYMLDSEDIKKLTEYQLEVFKDVFMTKDDGKELGTGIDRVQNTLDVILKDKQIAEQEVNVLDQRMKKAEDWIDEVSPKVQVKYEH